MTTADPSLDRYLDELRRELRPLPPATVAEIVAELRSHVRDSARRDGAVGADVADVLARLGPPADLAAQYRAELLIERAERSVSPWLPLQALARWASLSAGGAFALLGLIVGYVVAASLFVAALTKPFAPERVGLWRLAGGEVSLHLGLRGGPAPDGDELLGWWITPLGLLAGVAAYWLTLLFARACMRRHRPRRAAAGGHGAPEEPPWNRR